MTASFSPNPTTGSSMITLTASGTASLGQYNATIVGTYGKETASAPISVSVYAPSFSLYSYQGPVISPGSSGQGAVSIQPLYGFTGSVTLSVSGLPAGVTASFLPNPSADQSTVTLTASSSATPGQYNLTIKGVSGTQTATSIMPLTIKAPTFTLCCGADVTLGQGQTASTSVPLFAQNGFTKPVQLTATGLPAGVTASFSPNPATFLPNSTNSSSTLTLTASSSAAPGEYAVIVTGTGGGQAATTQVRLTVGVPSFTLYGPRR